jgi:hypothetical protein
MDGNIIITVNFLSVGTVRNWGHAGVVRARLGAALSVLSTGRVDAQAVGRGTCLRGERAPPTVIHAKLGLCCDRFAELRGGATHPPLPTVDTPFNPLLLQQLCDFREGLCGGYGQEGDRGNFSLLEADRVAISAPGEAGTASLEGILGSECPLLHPGF